MIPDDVRRTIKHALVAYWDANRWRYENDSMPHVDKAIDWLDNLPQPPEPVYSHRNGETEPPEVEGFYFVVARYGVNVVRLAKGALTQCGDANRYQVPIRAEVAYYGPIPEPQPENNTQ